MSSPYVSQELRERIAKQARYRCGYCLTTELLSGTKMEIEHILPLALGGSSEEGNLWLACSLCNEYKGVRVVGPDPLTGSFEPLFNPRLQSWNDHFIWTDDFERIVGKSATGRATVAALRLNRPLLARSRRIWVTTGLHPPK